MFCFVFYTVFPTDCVLGWEGKGLQGGASLIRMGPDTGLAGSAVPETRKCLEARPQGLLFVFTLWHWLLQHRRFYAVMSLKETKEKNLFCLFYLLLSKKNYEPKFQKDVLCFRNKKAIKGVLLHMIAAL